MENKILIDSVNNLKVALNEISVYDFDVYTSMELYYKIAENFNKVIRELSRFEGVISEEIVKQNEKLIYLLDEGLNQEVVNKIDNMVETGVFDTIINHNIFNNLKNDINNVNSQLEQNMNKINEKFNNITGLTNKHLEIINDKNDNVGNLNIANFSGQNLGSNAPIGQIFHHYTDGIAYQIDNVGENNNILILKNANNPSRRPDKANDFVGSGKFIQCLEHSTEGSSNRIFTLGPKGEMFWFDGDNPTVFGNNKSNNGSSAFKFDVYNKHGKLIEVSNGYTTEFLMNHNSINNQLELIAGLNASGGLKMQTINGPIELTSGNEQIIINGKPLVYNNGNYQSIQTIKNGTPQSRPTPIAIGDNYFDTQLGKPIWCKQISPSIIWVDATGATV